MRVIVDANPYIFHLDIKERWVISFKLQPPLHPDKETPLPTTYEDGRGEAESFRKFWASEKSLVAAEKW